MTADLDTGFQDYLVTNRDFMAPAVEQAIGMLDLKAARRVLDVGTGGGGALPALARATGPDALVVGVDQHPGVIELAARHAEQAGVRSKINLIASDVADVLAEAAALGGSFDAIWASDVVWPGNFADPGDLVRRFVPALAPGGVVAVFTSNYYQAMFLPGRSALERKLRTASELRWGLPQDGPHHHERHVSWLLAAGLRDVSLRVVPRVGFPLSDDPTVRPYLENAVLPELLASARSHGERAGMTAAELRQAEVLLDPSGPAYVLDEPGYYVVHAALLVSGRTEVSGR